MFMENVKKVSFKDGVQKYFDVIVSHLGDFVSLTGAVLHDVLGSSHRSVFILTSISAALIDLDLEA